MVPCPGGQGRHVEIEIAPRARLKVSGGQRWHTSTPSAPGNGLYVPRGHGTQVDGGERYVPAGHGGWERTRNGKTERRKTGTRECMVWLGEWRTGRNGGFKDERRDWGEDGRSG